MLIFVSAESIGEIDMAQKGKLLNQFIIEGTSWLEDFSCTIKSALLNIAKKDKKELKNLDIKKAVEAKTKEILTSFFEAFYIKIVEYHKSLEWSGETTVSFSSIYGASLSSKLGLWPARSLPFLFIFSNGGKKKEVSLSCTMCIREKGERFKDCDVVNPNEALYFLYCERLSSHLDNYKVIKTILLREVFKEEFKDIVPDKKSDTNGAKEEKDKEKTEAKDDVEAKPVYGPLPEKKELLVDSAQKKEQELIQKKNEVRETNKIIEEISRRCCSNTVDLISKLEEAVPNLKESSISAYDKPIVGNFFDEFVMKQEEGKINSKTSLSEKGLSVKISGENSDLFSEEQFKFLKENLFPKLKARYFYLYTDKGERDIFVFGLGLNKKEICVCFLSKTKNDKIIIPIKKIFRHVDEIRFEEERGMSPIETVHQARLAPPHFGVSNNIGQSLDEENLRAEALSSLRKERDAIEQDLRDAAKREQDGPSILTGNLVVFGTILSIIVALCVFFLKKLNM